MLADVDMPYMISVWMRNDLYSPIRVGLVLWS